MSAPARHLPAIAALLAALGAGIAAWRTGAGLRGLEERLRVLEGRSPAGETARASGAGTTSEIRPLPVGHEGSDPVPADPRAVELLRRLEARVAELEKGVAVPEIDPEQVIPGVANTPAEIEECRATLRDPFKDVWSKLRALRGLWMGAPEERTFELTRGMLDLLRAETNAEVRAEIVTVLYGVEDAEWRAEFLRILASDADPLVRRAAAKSLAPLAGESDVGPALEAAMRNDESEKVRRQAAASLKLPMK